MWYAVVILGTLFAGLMGAIVLLSMMGTGSLEDEYKRGYREGWDAAYERESKAAADDFEPCTDADGPAEGDGA